MTHITYQRQIVAIAGANRFHPAPAIDELPAGDALKTFVCFLALYARDVQTGTLPGDPYCYLPCRGERLRPRRADARARVPQGRASIRP